MATELDEGTQPLPEGEDVVNPGEDIIAAPEQQEETEQPEGDGTQQEPKEGDEEADPKPEGDNEPEQPRKPEKKKIPWELKRINEETNKRREAEKRLAEMEAELSRLRGDKPADTEGADKQPDIETIRREERERIRREESQRLETERFNAACNQTFEKGVETIPDFVEARDTLVNALGDEIQRRPEFLQAITELDNGHHVFYELGKNPEEAERILGLSPIKMAMELAKMSDKVSKPAPKPISKAPAPVMPVKGAAGAADRLDDEGAPMDQWANNYLKGLAAKRR